MAKNNGRAKLIGILITMGTILVGIGIAYATLSHGVEDNTGTNDKQDICIDANEKRLDKCEQAVGKQTVLLDVIQRNQTKMDGKLDRLLERP